VVRHLVEDGVLHGSLKVGGSRVGRLEWPPEDRDLAGHWRAVGAENGARHTLVQAEQAPRAGRDQLAGSGIVIDHHGDRIEVRREGLGDERQRARHESVEFGNRVGVIRLRIGHGWRQTRRQVLAAAAIRWFTRRSLPAKAGVGGKSSMFLESGPTVHAPGARSHAVTQP
jgi:hypothetical protein